MTCSDHIQLMLSPLSRSEQPFNFWHEQEPATFPNFSRHNRLESVSVKSDSTFHCTLLPGLSIKGENQHRFQFMSTLNAAASNHTMQLFFCITIAFEVEMSVRCLFRWHSVPWPSLCSFVVGIVTAGVYKGPWEHTQRSREGRVSLYERCERL